MLKIIHIFLQKQIYEYFKKLIKREPKLKKHESEKKYCKRVTAFDVTHLSKNEKDSSIPH